MFDFEKPNIEIAEISEDKRYGKFVVEPLERGYGTTLGNSLRRIMLSSLPGAAVSQVKIDGVLHEFSSIPGVKEDVTLNNLLSRKAVFQPHLPVRLPCSDLAQITGFALGRPSRSRTSGAPGFHGLTGGVYKARERIHRAIADARLLANPASWGRVPDPIPNCDRL